MKINFTKKEYATLIEMIDIANWIISANKIKKGPIEQPYEDLESKLFALSAEFDCTDKIEYSKEMNGYYQTRYFEFESPHRKFIDDYNEETFWEELIDKLATRDAILEIGEEAYWSLEPIERFEVLGKYEKKWADEFAENGLDNVAVET